MTMGNSSFYRINMEEEDSEIYWPYLFIYLFLLNLLPKMLQYELETAEITELLQAMTNGWIH